MTGCQGSNSQSPGHDSDYLSYWARNYSASAVCKEHYRARNEDVLDGVPSLKDFPHWLWRSHMCVHTHAKK